MKWDDGKQRCTWANPKNELYIHYHDQEWGIPVYDDHRLFEMLVQESFQAGLAWECVLNKRKHFRQAFQGNTEGIRHFLRVHMALDRG